MNSEPKKQLVEMREAIRQALEEEMERDKNCLLYTSPSPRD